MADADHGTRARYLSSCRCLPCRAANADYVRTHRPPERVDATTARAHLRALMALTPSIGVLQASKLSGLSRSLLLRIRNGQQQTITLSIQARVLAIQPIAAPGQRVNGYKTRDFIRRLVKEGYTRARLAALLGLRSRNLRWRGRTVTVRHEQKAQRLHARLTAEAL